MNDFDPDLKFTKVNEVNYEDRQVVCAAVKLPNGSIVCGARHYDMIMHSVLNLIPSRDQSLEITGFIDNYGNFLDRYEAMKLAISKGQLNNRRSTLNSYKGPKLFSEDLY